MSWEGYCQTLCEKGHLREHDEMGCEYVFGGPNSHEKCEECGAPLVAVAIVDTTNECDGYEGDYENHVDENCSNCSSKLKLEILTPAKTHTCECGNVHEVEEETYRLLK